METSRILYARHKGVWVFKLTGDLRQVQTGSFSSALALNQCVQQVLDAAQGEPVLVDLTEVEAIDSTHLGLVAHIGSEILERDGRRCALISTRPHITKLLQMMALDTVFDIRESGGLPASLLTRVECAHDAATDSMEVVLAAHRELSALSSENNEQFKQLIAVLGQQQQDLRGT